MDKEIENLVKLYRFKPMYTKQENEKVVTTQLDSWRKIITEHYRTTKTFVFSPDTNRKLFTNEELGRKVTEEFQKEIIDGMYMEGMLLDIIDLKLRLTSDRKFSKAWNSASSDAQKSEMLKADNDDTNTTHSGCFILFETVAFFTQVFLDYMEMNAGKDNIFTIYELSKCDALFVNRKGSPFVQEHRLAGADDDESMPVNLVVYIVYKGLVDTNVVYPIFEENELVAVKKI